MLSILHTWLKWFFLVQISGLLACAGPSQISQKPMSGRSLARLSRQIEHILSDSSLHQSRTGIKVISLQTGQTLYAKDSQLLFHPASNMKLLTTAAALKKLGATFRFKTGIYADTSAFADSVINGDLYIKGFANPNLSTKDLWWMIQKLKEMGLQKINGNLVCDESYLDDYYRGAGWMWDDASSASYSPIGALTVNRNCVTGKVKPGAEVGDSLMITLDPPTSYVTIENFGVTTDSSDTTLLKDFKIERKWRENQNSILITGGLSITSLQKVKNIEILQPALYFGTLFSELLARENITLNGGVTKGVTPDTNLVILEHYSEPLSSLILTTNKQSDNLFAELTLKTLGAEVFQVQGTAKAGLSAIKLLFSEIGVDTTAFGLADGSGVSRYNMISPNQIVALLQTIYDDFSIQAEFLASLPIAGVDGTLANRFKKTAAQGILRAKTGSIRGTSALSGYTETADGEPLAFSIIVEHFVEPISKIRSIQDRIGALLSTFER